MAATAAPIATTAPATRTEAIATKRPAETLTVVGAAGVLLARLFGVDNDDTLTALVVLVAFIPAAVTWLVQVLASARRPAPDRLVERLDDIEAALRRLQAKG
jgi:hypothetical protein